MSHELEIIIDIHWQWQSQSPVWLLLAQPPDRISTVTKDEENDMIVSSVSSGSIMQDNVCHPYTTVLSDSQFRG